MLNTLKAQCNAKVEEAFAKAEAHYNTTIPRVPVKYSKQLTACAGKAIYHKYDFTGVEIKLSVPVLENNPEEFVARTPGHEAAHIIAVTLFGHNGKGHGHRWAEVMRVIGQEPSVRHHMKTNTGRKQFEASCKCQTHNISKVRYNRILTGETEYSCKKCKSFLVVGPITEAERIVVPTVTKPQRKAAPQRKATTGKSNAQVVREFVNTNYSTEKEADAHFEMILNFAIPMFATRSAARSCCIANIPRVFK